MIRISISLEDAKPRSGTKIAYQAFPEIDATEKELDTSNLIIAFCSLLSNPVFLDLINPLVQKELVMLHEEQTAAIRGSLRTM